MKITAKTTKEQLINLIGLNLSAINKSGNKELIDTVKYTDKLLRKDPAKVKRADLVGIIKDAMNTLGDKFKEVATAPKPVVENSVKKPVGKESAKTERSGDDAETPKKPKTKGATKKKAPKKSGATVLNSEEESTEQAVLLADTFTDTLEVKDDDGDVITYEIAHDIKTMDDLMKSMEKGDVIVFAMYWTKRHLKQFPYFNGQFKAPKEFPLDLDLATCLYASDNGTCAYVMSMYTEGMYVIFPENLDEVNGVRFSNGIEFQIYRQVEA